MTCWPSLNTWFIDLIWTRGHWFQKFGRVHHGHHNYAFRGYVFSPAVEENRANFLRSNTFYVMQTLASPKGLNPGARNITISVKRFPNTITTNSDLSFFLLLLCKKKVNTLLLYGFICPLNPLIKGPRISQINEGL